jgi:division protein CdvB (Snf7/Vps24/ESCRT-III family)
MPTITSNVDLNVQYEDSIYADSEYKEEVKSPRKSFFLKNKVESKEKATPKKQIKIEVKKSSPMKSKVDEISQRLHSAKIRSPKGAARIN